MALLPHMFSCLFCSFALQVRVTEELAEATAQITQLQLELARHQKQEIDLHSQLNEALTESERQKALVNQLQAQLAGQRS